MYVCCHYITILTHPLPHTLTLTLTLTLILSSLSLPHHLTILLTLPEMTQITIEGNNITNMETLIHRIAYVNSRDFPTPGRRPISVVANILYVSSVVLG